MPYIVRWLLALCPGFKSAISRSRSLGLCSNLSPLAHAFMCRYTVGQLKRVCACKHVGLCSTFEISDHPLVNRCMHADSFLVDLLT